MLSHTIKHKFYRKNALAQDPSLKVGDSLRKPLPPIDFGRVAAQTAKQIVVQKVRDLERLHQDEEFKDRVGDLINGLVKRVEFGSVTIELGKAEALLRRDECYPGKHFVPAIVCGPIFRMYGKSHAGLKFFVPNASSIYG